MLMVAEDINNDIYEKRRFPRETLKVWVHYKTFKNGKISDPLESLTDNISAGGLGLRSDKEINPGQMIMVTLYLPPEESRKEAQDTMIFEESMCVPVSVLSKVAWCQTASDNEYRFGVQFLEMDDYSRSVLKMYLEHYHLYSTDSPVFN